MQEALSHVNIVRDPHLIVGFETSDDAAVYDLNGVELIQTVDIIAPVCDDPYTFGRIAAINSISDIYAMGGRPVTALSILAYPCGLGNAAAGAIVQGAADECAYSGCALCGGHTLSSDEVRFGLSVTGVSTGKIYRNSSLRVGDLLILTKPIGSGIIATAMKGGLASEESLSAMISNMLLSNEKASMLMRLFDVSACTDVTGFGLAGHAVEMAKGARVNIRIISSAIPLLPNVLFYASMGLIPAGAYNNENFITKYYTDLGVTKELLSCLTDPQTSGGLLIGVSSRDAVRFLNELKNEGFAHSSIIGEIISEGGSIIIEK